MTARWVPLVITAAAAVVIVAAYPGGLSGSESDAAWVAWALTPIVLLLVWSTLDLGRPPSRPRRLLLSAIAVAYAAMFSWGAASSDESSTGGLVFLFLPLYGVVAVVTALGLTEIATGLRFLRKR